MSARSGLKMEAFIGPADFPSSSGFGEAFELKFLLSIDTARMVEAWARAHLRPDPHGLAGSYRTTTLYCDTLGLDIFFRSPGHRRSKYRVRRYGEGPAVYLERKTKKGDRVRKMRERIPVDALPSLARPDQGDTWFHRQVHFHDLRPICRIAYDRTAFVGHSSDGGLRLTLDRHPVCVPADGWSVPALHDGMSFLPDRVILELKYHASLPTLFRGLLAELPVSPSRGSKYRSCVEELGIARRVC
jgi:hypothetical protein